MSARPTLFVLILIAIASPFNASANPFPGYYIDKSGDSVACIFQNFKDWEINPSTISVTVNNQSLTLTPSDIKGFGVSGYDDYTSATVSYYLNAGYIKNATDKFSDERATKTVFLRVLSEGKYSLYQLKTNSRLYYFIQLDKSDTVRELPYRVRRVDMKIEEDTRFRNILFEYFSNEGLATQYVKMISNASYNNNDVARLVNILNGKERRPVKKKKHEASFQGDVYVGGSYFMFPAAIPGTYAGDVKLKSTFSPSFGINAMYFVPGRFRSLAIGLSVGYTSYNTSRTSAGADSTVKTRYTRHFTQYSEKLSTSNSLLQMNIYGQYAINPLSKVRVYVKLGLNANVSLVSDRDVYSEYEFSQSGLKNDVPFSWSDAGHRTMMSFPHTLYYDINSGVGFTTGRHRLEFMYHFPYYLDPLHDFKISAVGCTYYFAVLR